MRQQNLYDPATAAYDREMKPAVPQDDRYLARRTADGTFNKATYTKEGIDWIADNGFASVLLRHFPALGAALYKLKNPLRALECRGPTAGGRASTPALESRPGGRRVPPTASFPERAHPR